MLNRIVLKYLALLFAAVLWLSGCSGGDNTSAKTDASFTDSQATTKQSVVLAYVDGSPITETEVEQAFERLFSSQIPNMNRDQVKEQILQSLISSRAISRLAERELDTNERQALDARVSAYREELLVKEYLSNHASPEPVSTDMVEKYYRDHPEEFGGGMTKRFEIVQTHRALNDDERREVIQQLGGLTKEDNWEQWVESNKYLPVGWRELTTRVEVLEQPLRTLVSSAEPGAISPLHIDQRITIIRVNAIEEHSPKPLKEVSAEIRKKLAPIKLKEAIKILSDKAVEQLKVKIVETVK